MASHHSTSKLAHSATAVISAAAIFGFGWLLKVAVKFFNTIYPEIYSRSILGRVEAGDDLNLPEKWVLVFRAAWPVLTGIGILSAFIAVFAYALLKALVGLSRRSGD